MSWCSIAGLADRLHDMLGKRYEFADGSSVDVTLVSYDPHSKTVRLHAVGGGRQTLPRDLFLRAILDGHLQESDKPGFVHDRETRFERERAARLERRKHHDAVGIQRRGGTIPLALVRGKRR